MSFSDDLADLATTVVETLGAVSITLTLKAPGARNTTTNVRAFTTQTLTVSAVREDAVMDSVSEAAGRTEREERVYLVDAADIPAAVWSTIIGSESPCRGDLLTDGEFEGEIVAGEAIAQSKALRLRVRRGHGGGAV